MKKMILSGIVLALMLGLVVSSGYARSKRLVIQGSTTVLPIAQRCAEEYMNQHPEVDISVRGGGSGTGIAALIDGICDIADSSRPIKSKEVTKAKGKGINPQPHIVARDGIAVIVHPSNPIRRLYLDQVRDIYTGKVSNWGEVGGMNQPIVIISRDVASGTYECFNKLALKKEKVRPDALLQASNQAVASTVGRTKVSIGYIGLGYLSSKVKAVTVECVIPSVETVLDDSYPIARPLFMYTNGKPKGLAKDFIDFVLSAEGQKIAAEEGFVALK